jgi:hypothetical protein
LSTQTRFRFLLLATAVLGLLTGNVLFSKTPPPKPIERPNFLLVITDDQSWKHTSFAGYPAVKTPNFDRLASEGVYFRNAYTSAPTCTASRSAILTGATFLAPGVCRSALGRISYLAHHLSAAAGKKWLQNWLYRQRLGAGQGFIGQPCWPCLQPDQK